MKWFIIGLLIGIVSFIPGISGGTILYLSGEYDNFTHYLSNIKKKYPFILLILIGALLGILLFSKVIEYCFLYYPEYTKLFFAYLVLFSLPKFIKEEKIKLKFIPFLLSFLFLLILSFFTSTSSIANIPSITIKFIIFFTLCGFLDGFITIIPGISGSMIMMILGPYFLYKTICANVLNNFIFIIPLLFYFLGDFLGIILGSKTTTIVINKNPNLIHSIILGFIISSLIILIPFSKLFTFESIILLLISYILDGLISISR